MSEGFAYLLVMTCMLALTGCSDATKSCAKHMDSASCIQDAQCDWSTDKNACAAKP